jgi:hypothetical protein
MRSPPEKYMIVGLVGWVSVIIFGWTLLSQYANTPGQSHVPPSHWPSQSVIPRTSELPTLLIFLHPRCPCSRATVAQLSIIMTRAQNKVKTHVIFVKPPNFSQEEVKTDLWNSAIHIPGVHAMIDENEQEAKRFNVEVSGQVLLYDAQGQLVFSGGITSSRGHQGDNDGQDAIIAFLTEGKVLRTHTPFFGCRVFRSQEKK